MFNISGIFERDKEKTVLSKDELAKLLGTSPEALAAFERSYTDNVINSQAIRDNLFQVNSRQAASMQGPHPADSRCENIVTRIVNELLAQTSVYSYKNGEAGIKGTKALPQHPPVEPQDIDALPIAVRPQVTGCLMKKDIQEDSSLALMWAYREYLSAMQAHNRKKQADMYNLFRQGLDILDLDPVTYQVLGKNMNSMGNWLPPLAEAIREQSFFKIPATKILKVPITLLQLTRIDFDTLTPTTLRIVDAFCKKAFELDETKEYFIKTGTYSSKFDFRNAYVHGAKEVNELGEYLLYIHYQALQMASPLSRPCIYGASTTNEWVVREFIKDKENNPCIYKGLPLHTEYRVFVDFDTDEIIGINPYWAPDVMKQRFGNEADSNEPDKVHDYIIYQMHEETLMRRYAENEERVQAQIKSFLQNVDLPGQWSIDVMQNGNDFYIIDMATAATSALNQCIPAGKMKVAVENWLPEIQNS